MSKVKPIFITPANPIGLDKIIAELQSVIIQAIYVDELSNDTPYFNQGLILPLALKDEQNNTPIVYWKGGDYYPAEPNDNYRVTCFFYQEDSAKFDSINSIQYTLNLVVWFNQDKYTRNKNYQIKEYFIAQIESLIRDYLRLENKTSIEIFRELENVFSNYSMTKEQKTRMKYPFQSFRIRFNISDDLDCGDSAKLDLTL